jgi:hypothetical protein
MPGFKAEILGLVPWYRSELFMHVRTHEKRSATTLRVVTRIYRSLIKLAPLSLVAYGDVNRLVHIGCAE